VADGTTRRLDPRHVQLEQVINAIFGAALSGMLLLVTLVLWLARGPHIDTLAASILWFPLTALLVWLTVRWPHINYRHWRYRVAPDGIEIWSGVLWRQAVAVPRSRVQHIDVSQGPIERSYGLATLSVYTAGTQYSKVDLPGLDHGVAIAIRDALLPKDAEPTV
jgi:membrane protein YdbS with pleckstrin-like domain